MGPCSADSVAAVCASAGSHARDVWPEPEETMIVREANPVARSRRNGHGGPLVRLGVPEGLLRDRVSSGWCPEYGRRGQPAPAGRGLGPSRWVTSGPGPLVEAFVGVVRRGCRVCRSRGARTWMLAATWRARSSAATVTSPAVLGILSRLSVLYRNERLWLDLIHG
jgi:hypothetical protein